MFIVLTSPNDGSQFWAWRHFATAAPDDRSTASDERRRARRPNPDRKGCPPRATTPVPRGRFPVLPRPACRRSLVARSCAGLRAVACCAGLHPVLKACQWGWRARLIVVGKSQDRDQDQSVCRVSMSRCSRARSVPCANPSHNRLSRRQTVSRDRRAALKFDLECAISAGSVDP